MKYIGFCVVVVLLQSCQTRLVLISKRDVSNEKKGTEIYKKGRKIDQNKIEQSQVYLRKKNIEVKPIYEIDNSGSLFSAENPESYLFYEKKLGEVGDVLPVLTRVNMGEAGSEPDQVEGEIDADKLKDELLSALPEFTPSEENGDLKALTSINFKVDRKLANGDLIVSTYRSSLNKVESSVVMIKARIPRLKIMENRALTTNDLLDVEWYQRADGDEVERRSISWQDDYTLRLSGFTEAKSKYAQELEVKRSDLVKIRGRLRERINSLGAERQKFSIARKDLDMQKRKLGDTLKNYSNQIDDYKNTIEEQKSILKKQQEIIDGSQQSGTSPGDERGRGDNG